MRIVRKRLKTVEIFFCIRQLIDVLGKLLGQDIKKLRKAIRVRVVLHSFLHKSIKLC